MPKILVIDRCYYSRTGLAQLISESALSIDVVQTDDLLRAREYMKWKPDIVIADFYGFLHDLHHIDQLSSIFAASSTKTRFILLPSARSAQLENYCATQDIWFSADKSCPLEAVDEALQNALTRMHVKVDNRHIASLLTLREEQILQLWKKGDSNESIAECMQITVKTVYTYKRNIRMKLGANNRFTLFRRGTELAQI
ncbi:helix-turn-helix transcriptional regulator [Atlantibacter subterraneus]|uniref:helix-turn-helix transcriptional regulator n=1 Tax=Atlantibacter subterraneus TaxID=255519 RepID=UPI0028AD9119|nr:LuxR C-terminal-related transcriptional regulator [Atlantibacter subterranea]MDW2742479.1 LuxR C-terminal-related transcriptional regulator [Atlantibacter subterranea]